MAEITWKSILTKLVGGDHLTAEESEWFVDDLMQGNANPAAVGAALAMQQQLGLTADEVRGAAKAMVSHAVPLNVSGGTTDIVGTGGDGFATVNLSTMGSVAAAAAGVKIVKHGNRAASSKCGAADVLEDLGLPLDLKPEAVGEVGDEVGITFAFARTFHPAMRFVGPIRAALGIPCVFNILGPLTNPANPAHVAIGADIDPDAAILYNMDGARAVSTAETGESGFIVSCGLQGESYDQLLVLESLEQQENNAAILYFADTAFVDQVCQGFGASWRYLENDAADSAQESPQEATYTLRFVDADGAPVAGVMVNICSDTFCFAPAVTGTDGVATFTGAPYAYEVHVLHAPTGYQWDDAQTITLPAAGGEVVLSLSKE